MFDVRDLLPPAGSEAAAYGRHSSDMQNPKSAGDQLELAQVIADQHDWRLNHRYSDEARTGRSSRNRPQFNAMISDALSGRFKVIIVEDLSRLMRNAAEMGVVAQKLKEAGVTIYLASMGPINAGILMSVLAVLAQEQSEEHGRKTSRGHRAGARRGRVMGGVAYGYRVRTGTSEQAGFRSGKNADGGSDLNREPDPVTKLIVRRIYDDYVSGLSTVQICQRLNAEGVPAPKGNIWRPRVLTGDASLSTGILRSSLYRGVAVFGKTVSTFSLSTGQTKVTPGKKVDQIEVVSEDLRIVSDEVFFAAKERLQQQSVEHGSFNKVRRPQYVLSGKVRCGACGQPYAIVGVNYGCTGRRHGNGCENRRRVRRVDLEQAVFDGMRDRLLHPNNLSIYVDEYHAELAKARAEYNSTRDVLEKRRVALQRETESLLAQAKAGATGYARNRINQALNEAGAELEKIERQLALKPEEVAMDLSAEGVSRRLGELVDALGDTTAGSERDCAAARDLLRAMVDEVIVSPMPATGKEDGRGFGPVRVEVFGSLTKVIDYAGRGREIQGRGTTAAALELPTTGYSYYVEFAPAAAHQEHPPTAAQVFLSILQNATAPIEKSDLIAKLADHEDMQGAGAADKARLAAEAAIRFLKRRGDIRAVDLQDWKAGWVLDSRGLTDDEWRARFRGLGDAPPQRRWTVVSPPEAFVVVINKSS